MTKHHVLDEALNFDIYFDHLFIHSFITFFNFSFKCSFFLFTNKDQCLAIECFILNLHWPIDFVLQ